MAINFSHLFEICVYARVGIYLLLYGQLINFGASYAFAEIMYFMLYIKNKKLERNIK